LFFPLGVEESFLVIAPVVFILSSHINMCIDKSSFFPFLFF